MGDARHNSVGAAKLARPEVPSARTRQNTMPASSSTRLCRQSTIRNQAHATALKAGNAETRSWAVWNRCVQMHGRSAQLSSSSSTGVSQDEHDFDYVAQWAPSDTGDTYKATGNNRTSVQSICMLKACPEPPHRLLRLSMLSPPPLHTD